MRIQPPVGSPIQDPWQGSPPVASGRWRDRRAAPPEKNRRAPLSAVRAVAGKDGTFVIGSRMKDDGAPEGEYAVTVVWPEEQDPQKQFENTPPDRLKNRYNDLKNPKWRIRVSPGENCADDAGDQLIPGSRRLTWFALHCRPQFCSQSSFWRTSLADAKHRQPRRQIPEQPADRPAAAGKKQEEPSQAAARAENTVFRAGVPYGADEKQRLNVYSPRGAVGAPVVVFIHGGEWLRHDKAEVSYKPKFLNENGIVLVSVNYRLSPAVTHPAHVSDVAAAVRWVARPRRRVRRFCEQDCGNGPLRRLPPGDPLGP